MSVGITVTVHLIVWGALKCTVTVILDELLGGLADKLVFIVICFRHGPP
jgi:hypothetical protein